MANKVTILLLSILLGATSMVKAIGNKDTIPLVKVDDEITLFDPLDTLTNSLFNACYKFNKPKPNKYGFDTSYVPIYPDEVIMKNMAQIPSVIPLVYNQWVKGFINLYSVRKREQVRRMLGLSEMYFPIFEEALDKRKMPMELKYLAIIESALNPNATSKVGATGLWQLMYSTGRFLNMEIHSYVDDRRDPYKSTDAAVNYLHKLYDIYGDWTLVIAAYNCGPGNVNKAIKRSGGKTNFWEIKPYLPKETQGYVPAFIAAMYVLHYYEDFNYRPEPCGFSFNATDSVIVREAMSLQQIADGIKMNINELVYLNPSLTKRFIPATQNGFALRLPINKVGLFVQKKDSIIKSMPSAMEELQARSSKSELPNDDIEEITTTVKKSHTVKSGESITKIANKYSVSVAQIKKWNSLRANAVHPGQKLKILVATKKVINKHHTAIAAIKQPVQPATEEATNDSEDTDNAATTVKYEQPASGQISLINYTVKPGDNFTAICRQFSINPTDLKTWNNLNDLNVKVGQKLKLYIDAANVDKFNGIAQKGIDKVTDEEPVTNEPAEDDPSVKVKHKTTYYTVKSGDTLWEISKKYPGVTVEQIKHANNISAGKGLRIGMKLKIEH